MLSWLLREVLVGGERVEYADLKWRAERFLFLVLVRPDGYLVAAPTGTPLQRLGPLQLVEGVWKVSPLVVGDFYFSRGGVFYPVNEALRRVDVPPLTELGLGRDPLNAALDGAQDALGEMVVALAQSILHPIRTVEDLTQLHGTVALLVASSPEYFARYGAMSREDQIREAARLSTHVLMMFGERGPPWGAWVGWGHNCRRCRSRRGASWCWAVSPWRELRRPAPWGWTWEPSLSSTWREARRTLVVRAGRRGRPPERLLGRGRESGRTRSPPPGPGRLGTTRRR
ncbi:hypothetical protein ACN28S_04245 [Cystobacter fuscus]